MKKRYSITYCNREGMRALLPSCNYSTSKEAENWLRLLTDRIKSLRLPPEIKRKLQATLRVDPVECHDTGEPLCLYIDESATVQEVKDGQVILDNGRTFAPAKFATFLDVGLAREVDFAYGDLVLVRQNLKSQKLVNGEVLQVASISPDGEIHTQCGKIIPSGFSKISHGYSVTSHKAQGMTSRHSVVVAAQLDSKSTYVACSRGRESCVVVTPDAETLLSRLPEGSKRNAMDFVAGKTNALNKLHSHLSARRRQLHAWASRMMRVDSKRLLRIVKAGRRYLRTAIGQSILRTRRSTLFPMKTVSLPLPLPVWGTATLRTGRGGK